MRDYIKNIAFRLLTNPKRISNRIGAISCSNASVVLNLHRVAPDDGSSYSPLSPSIFEALIKFLIPNFQFTTISDLITDSNKPKIVLSFDDGYADFYEYAAPILSKYGIKANHNLIPECIETGLPPLNILAQDFIGKAPKELVERLEIPGFGLKVTKYSGNAVSRHLKFMRIEKQNELRANLLLQFYNFEEFQPTKMMNLEQIKEIGVQLEIGAHSFAHASMEHETNDYLRDDVLKCKEYFNHKLDKDIQIYALPNGSCKPNQLDIIRSAGIRHVLLVGEQFSQSKKQCEPIYRFTFDARSIDEMKYKATGRNAGFRK